MKSLVLRFFTWFAIFTGMGELFFPSKLVFAIWLLLLWVLPVGASSSAYGTEITNGYLMDVENEVSNDPVELVLVDKPDSLNGPNFNEKVFNHELSQEFIFKYQQIFGRTEQEENYYLINRQGYFVSAGVLTSSQLDTARREFAQYMAKRLAEYHSDNALKTDPQFKKIYEIKQAVSNVNLQVSESTKFDMTYSFVGGTSSVKMTHAFSNVIALITMDPGQFFSLSPIELELIQQKNWTKSFRSEFGFKFYNKAYRFSLFKTLSPVLELNFTQTLPVVAGFSNDNNRETLSLAGMKFIF